MRWNSSAKLPKPRYPGREILSEKLDIYLVGGAVRDAVRGPSPRVAAGLLAIAAALRVRIGGTSIGPAGVAVEFEF